ncbi:hypothetical protein [uncultured Pelagimonas sp.]|uniref:hypothetical protein n=1 Tax=uncultured Pelagimonas sp. TaxID=1618102 RepID=UPI0026365B02|nr:hypothetical protein [uncultured Pelagimonas sp.]
MRGLVLVVLFWCSAAAVVAADDRMERLRNGQALEWIEATGHWDVTFSDRQMVMICTTCDGMVEVVLEALPFLSNDRLWHWEADYMAERKRFCSSLVQEGGRCLGTDNSGFRGRALRGFQSSHDHQGVKTTDVIWYNNSREYGPELLRTRVKAEQGHVAPEGTANLIYSAMAQLTNYW